MDRYALVVVDWRRRITSDNSDIPALSNWLPGTIIMNEIKRMNKAIYGKLKIDDAMWLRMDLWSMLWFRIPQQGIAATDVLERMILSNADCVYPVKDHAFTVPD